MAEIRQIIPRAAVEEAASRWIARLEADDTSQEDRLRFQAWLDEDGAHREAFEAMRITWHRLDALALGAVGAPTLPGTQSRHDRLRRLPFAAAAVLVLAIGSAALWLVGTPNVVQYETAVGQQKSVKLDDGSVVQLNTDTLLTVDYTEERRTVALVRGEAHFDVASDVERPFVVRARSGLIRAVGTAFNVYLSSERSVEVTVTEGVVEVLRDDTVKRRNSDGTSKAVVPARVTENHRVSYDSRGLESGEVAAMPVPNLDRRLAWRHGMLSFDGQTLAAVVREVSRYTDIQFEFADSTLRDV